MHAFILYASYAIFPFLIGVIYLTYKFKTKVWQNKLLLLMLIFFYLLSGVFIYAGFIERYMIHVQTTQIETGFKVRVAVISDMHLGLYKNEKFLEKVVAKINAQPTIEAVLIPGDFTYDPPTDLESLFAALKDIKVPVYAVLGNHDSEQPGPPIQKPLQNALEKNGVNFLNNTHATLPNSNIHILGLGDNWAQEDDIKQINAFKPEDHLIVLTHNPDTTLAYENSIPDITIAGHTHGGQIRIPFLYKHAIPCRGDFDQGIYHTPTGKVFVTSGLGEVGLPMRFLIPPVIDILEFY